MAYDVPLRVSFGQLLDQAVELTGMSLSALSLDMGYSQSAVSQVRHGRAKRMSPEMALYLEARLGPGWAEALVVASARHELELKRRELGL